MFSSLRSPACLRSSASLTLIAAWSLLLALFVAPELARAQDSTVSALSNASAPGTYPTEFLYLEAGAACPGVPPASSGCSGFRLTPAQVKTYVLSGLSFSSLSGTVTGAQLPNPGASSLGGIDSITSASHEWVSYIDTSGLPHQSQPAASDISGLAASATTDTTNPANIHTGIIRQIDADAVSLSATGDITTTTIPVARYTVGSARVLNCTGSPGTAELQIWTGAGGTGVKLADYTSFSGATGTTIVNGTGSSSTVATAGTLYDRVIATGSGACDFNMQIIDLP